VEPFSGCQSERTSQFRYVVEVADEFARLVVDGVVAFFEGVEFFKDLYRDGHIVFCEVLDGRVVVEDD
jgi:hypothetical protein